MADGLGAILAATLHSTQLPSDFPSWPSWRIFDRRAVAPRIPHAAACLENLGRMEVL